ncbi:MAG: CoA transferase [Oscillospiraceae bacterium]|jgi:cinnamoyl-CoA:phenyllactate CoA-transferase|nr:CoA transferase [Oscillospiraceae bacterium]
MSVKKPLEGIRVIEMSTFIAVPATARFFAEFGAEVIKVEPKSGDNVRFNGVSEGRLGSPYENTTFDLENAHKKGIILNLKAPEGREILFKLLADADIFLTNWRPQALEKLGLDYDSLKDRFPKLVYGSLTGYGETGPDKDLPGYDFTAFWARSGLLGTLYQAGGEPNNLIPGIGDHTAGMNLAAGCMVALHKAQATGVGDKVLVNLLHSAIFAQAIAVQAAQYKGLGKQYPISRSEAENPFNNTYKSSDGKFIQISMPPFDLFYPKFMPLIGREDLVGNERYTMASITKNELHREFIAILEESIAKKTAAEWAEIFTKADVPFAVAAVWEEVLEDEQAWAIEAFESVDYPTGKRAMVRQPIELTGADKLPYGKAPQLGEHSEEVLLSLGYTQEQLQALHEAGVYNTFDDVKDKCGNPDAVAELKELLAAKKR